jgi:NTE family protein
MTRAAEQAQEVKTNVATPQSRPITISDIANRSSEVSNFLGSLDTQPAPSDEVEKIRKRLPQVIEYIQQEQPRTEGILGGQPTLGDLQTLQQLWQTQQKAVGGTFTRDSLPVWSADLWSGIRSTVSDTIRVRIVLLRQSKRHPQVGVPSMTGKIIMKVDPVCSRAAMGLFIRLCTIVVLIGLSGCAHYTVNSKLAQCDPQVGYRGKNFIAPEKDDQLLLMLTFSGGGTRAAAFSYGVLEALRDSTVNIRGSERRLLDEVDWISGVSGGSFTAAYYGLFRERMFKDFEDRFLKKNIQSEITRSILFNPVSWGKLYSPYFDRSDLAAEYYDKHVFEGGTFGDILAQKAPMIVINATDMVHGTRFTFNQDTFDVICSDLASFPVARACAASSAVPIVLTPITLRNYAGSCGYHMPKVLEEAMEPPRDLSSRRFDLANSMMPFLDSKEKPYIHLVDGGVADNLGLRAVLERVTIAGDPWTTLKYAGMENVHKIVFVLVNAETETDTKWDRFEKIPPFGAMLDSFSSIGIWRYNQETVSLLRESFKRWEDEIRKGRCGSSPISTEPGACGDIEFYLVEVRFDAIADGAERSLLKRLPTSFALKPEQVDHLRNAARQILGESKEFKRLVQDLQQGR